MGVTWLTADTHLGHARIAEYCDRPPHHEELIVAGWKARMKPGDRLIHLGDFSLCGMEGARRWFAEIPEGVETVLVEGNHDARGKLRRLPWGEVVRLRSQPLVEELHGLTFSFSHHPPGEVWGDVVCHGHLHEKGVPVRRHRDSLVACLCVELWGYLPVRADDLASRWRP